MSLAETSVTVTSREQSNYEAIPLPTNRLLVVFKPLFLGKEDEPGSLSLNGYLVTVVSVLFLH